MNSIKTQKTTKLEQENIKIRNRKQKDIKKKVQGVKNKNIIVTSQEEFMIGNQKYYIILQLLRPVRDIVKV